MTEKTCAVDDCGRKLASWVAEGHHGCDEHRRLHFIENGTGPRLVDPRTVNFVVVGRVKYVVK